MTLSIIIVNYNTADLISSCIESIKNSAFGSVEVIVVDNNSNDNSVEKIKREKVKLIQNTENLGFAKAVNQGIKAARGEYILLLNPDTQIKNAAIEKLLKFAQNTNDCGAVGPKLLNPDESTQDSAFKFLSLIGAIREYWLGQKGKYSKYTPRSNQASVVDSLVMACFLITPKALNKVGFLDEKFFMYYEDIDYCRRIKEAGLKVYYLPQAKVIHHHGVSGRNLASDDNQWRRLIPSSKKYHGALMHYLINFILWSGQKFKKIIS